MKCTNVPSLISINSFNNDYEAYEEALYEKYKISFENNQFYFNGKKICHKKYPLHNNKSGTFWHIISSGKNNDSRVSDLKRAERIEYPAFLLSYCKDTCKQIKIWKNNRKGKTRVLIWCEDIDYLVILDDRKSFYIFWTAYPVTYKHARTKLQKEYAAYCNANNMNE